MKRILLLLAVVLSSGFVTTCNRHKLQEQAQDVIVRYCLDRPDEFPGYEPVSFREITEIYSNPDFDHTVRDTSRADDGENVLMTPPSDPNLLKHTGWMTYHSFNVLDDDGVPELRQKVFCLDLKLTRITRVSDKW